MKQSHEASLYSPRILPRTRVFPGAESVTSLGGAAVLVAPLSNRGEIVAVVYLERDIGDGPFSAEAQAFIREFGICAGQAFARVLRLQALEAFKREHDRRLLAEGRFPGIIANHPNMLRLLKTVVQVADSDATVLVNGETGTGKELIARAIHLNSGRVSKPYVTIHCGALPDTLFESELFGHKKGAFTGAVRDRAGRISEAAGGTLFIDEIAEIPLTVQAKLLRFFQFGELQRVGSDHVKRLDVRIIAATHQNLEKMVAEGRFRQDLYYRLNVLELEIPPLRARKSDIPLLIEHFLKQFWKRDDAPPAFSHRTMTMLEHYDYPGNVRELAHIVERATVLVRGPIITEALLPKGPRKAWRSGADQELPQASFEAFTNQALKKARETATLEAVHAVERAFLDGLLEENGGDIPAAAKLAGMHRTYLYRLISKHKKR